MNPAEQHNHHTALNVLATRLDKKITTLEEDAADALQAMTDKVETLDAEVTARHHDLMVKLTCTIDDFTHAIRAAEASIEQLSAAYQAFVRQPWYRRWWWTLTGR